MAIVFIAVETARLSFWVRVSSLAIKHSITCKFDRQKSELDTKMPQSKVSLTPMDQAFEENYFKYLTWQFQSIPNAPQSEESSIQIVTLDVHFPNPGQEYLELARLEAEIRDAISNTCSKGEVIYRVNIHGGVRIVENFLWFARLGGYISGVYRKYNCAGVVYMVPHVARTVGSDISRNSFVHVLLRQNRLESLIRFVHTEDEVEENIRQLHQIVRQNRAEK